MTLAFVLGLSHVLFYSNGFMDEWDYWAGTFGLVILAAIEIILFAYIFGIGRGWREIHRGADIRVPSIYRPIMQWVTPLFLIVLLVWWGVEQAVPTLLMENVQDPSTIPYRWASRLMILGMLAVLLWMINRAWTVRPSTERATPGAEE
jgi:hypothetical protein